MNGAAAPRRPRGWRVALSVPTLYASLVLQPPAPVRKPPRNAAPAPSLAHGTLLPPRRRAPVRKARYCHERCPVTRDAARVPGARCRELGVGAGNMRHSLRRLLCSASSRWPRTPARPDAPHTRCPAQVQARLGPSRPSPDRGQDGARVGVLLAWRRSSQKNAYATWHFPKKRNARQDVIREIMCFPQTEDLAFSD